MNFIKKIIIKNSLLRSERQHNQYLLKGAIPLSHATHLFTNNRSLELLGLRSDPYGSNRWPAGVRSAAQTASLRAKKYSKNSKAKGRSKGIYLKSKDISKKIHKKKCKILSDLRRVQVRVLNSLNLHKLVALHAPTIQKSFLKKLAFISLSNRRVVDPYVLSQPEKWQKKSLTSPKEVLRDRDKEREERIKKKQILFKFKFYKNYY